MLTHMETTPSREEMSEILRDRAERVMEAVKRDEAVRTGSTGRFLAEMANLLDQLVAGQGIAAAEWQDHELAWQAYVAERREALVAATSRTMLSLEAMARDKPETVTPDLAKELHWWQEEGGREEWLGQLPLETRRALEEEAKKWPLKEGQQ